MYKFRDDKQSNSHIKRTLELWEPKVDDYVFMDHAHVSVYRNEGNSLTPFFKITGIHKTYKNGQKMFYIERIKTSSLNNFLYNDPIFKHRAGEYLEAMEKVGGTNLYWESEGWVIKVHQKELFPAVHTAHKIDKIISKEREIEENRKNLEEHLLNMSDIKNNEIGEIRIGNGKFIQVK